MSSSNQLFILCAIHKLSNIHIHAVTKVTAGSIHLLNSVLKSSISKVTVSSKACLYKSLFLCSAGIYMKWCFSRHWRVPSVQGELFGSKRCRLQLPSSNCFKTVELRGVARCTAYLHPVEKLKSSLVCFEQVPWTHSHTGMHTRVHTHSRAGVMYRKTSADMMWLNCMNQNVFYWDF